MTAQRTRGTVIAAALGLALLAGCPEEGSAEKAGKQLDDAAEEVQDKAEDVAEDVSDKAEDIADKAEDAADDTDGN